MKKFLLPSQYCEVTPKDWREAKIIGQSLNSFIFRGQSDHNWQLTTSIERAAIRFNCPFDDLWEREREVLRNFKARAHHFIQSPPKESENVEWLSLIQDYGGPTRLLDFTTSYYVASYFAIESAKGDSCVWAINNINLLMAAFEEKQIGLETNVNYSLNPKPVLHFAESLITDESTCLDLVLCVIPPRLNERLATQRGLFLFPCDISKKFEYCLCKSFKLTFDTLTSDNSKKLNVSDFNNELVYTTSIIKINLSRSIHSEILKDLYSMNIDSATLFPGLEGFTKSLMYSIQSIPNTVSVLNANVVKPPIIRDDK